MHCWVGPTKCIRLYSKRMLFLFSFIFIALFFRFDGFQIALWSVCQFMVLLLVDSIHNSHTQYSKHWIGRNKTWIYYCDKVISTIFTSTNSIPNFNFACNGISVYSLIVCEIGGPFVLATARAMILNRKTTTKKQKSNLWNGETNENENILKSIVKQRRTHNTDTFTYNNYILTAKANTSPKTEITEREKQPEQPSPSVWYETSLRQALEPKPKKKKK